ncbi:MAG TPA: hypothetical protein VLQ90_03045, partial [Pyrinomonadaceae bacterium]|nr:hypothetical protein [Pyrinomonadaceae bacterium]
IGRRDASIKIVYNDPELRITRTFVRNGQPVDREFVYYTDGRGETNKATILLTSEPGRVKPEDIEKQDVKSKTKWERDKIVIRTTLQSRVDRYSLSYLLVDEWKISGDGKSLTQTSRFRPDQTTTPTFVPATRPDEKRFYVLVSK